MDNITKYYKYCDDNVIEWSAEAAAVIKDIAQHVKAISISDKMPPTRTESYINVTTLKGDRMCIKLNAEGLQMVGNDYDAVSQENAANTRYETPYALLSDVCPLYVQSFGNSLANALNKLEHDLREERKLSDVE